MTLGGETDECKGRVPRGSRRCRSTFGEDVRTKIADVGAMERALKDTVARCANAVGSHCPAIEALYREAPSLSPRIAAV